MPGRASITWDKSLAPNIEAGGAIFLMMLRAELASVASQMQAFAKANHPWQNQTGDAEATFTVRVEGMSIVAQHGVSYGVYLEFKFGGRDGIIPATMAHGAALLNGAYAKAWAASWRFG